MPSESLSSSPFRFRLRPLTGVLLAYLFEVRLKYAIPAIFAGATVACALLTAGATGAPG